MSTTIAALPSTVGVLIALLLSSTACGAAEPLTASFEVTAKEITLHEPIFLQVTLVNSDPNSITVTLGANSTGNYRFALVDSEGRRVEAPVPEADGFYYEDTLSLHAGERHTQRLLLDQWIQIEKPGKYHLEAWLSGDASSADGRKLQPPAVQSLALEVLPRSEERLRGTCRQLANTATQLHDMDQSLIAAEALSRIGDPIAVSALDQVLKSGFLPIQYLAVQGLKRIHDKPAVEALSDALGQGGEIGREARAALDALRRTETNTEILEMIEEAGHSVDR